MKRRTFLQSSLASAAMAPVLLGKTYARPSTPLKLLSQLNEQSNNNKILILVQLFGGNDGLNTIIPADDDAYYNLRPNIGILKSALTNYNYGGIYFNPGLANGNKGGLFQMFQNGTLAVIQGIGYDTPNLSHFYSTDIWLSGIVPEDSSTALTTGWLGRYLEQQNPNFPTTLPPDPLAINLGGFSLALMGTNSNMGIVVDSPSLQAGGLSSTDNSLDDNATGTRYATEYAFVQSVAQMSNTYATRVKNAYSTGSGKLTGNYGSDSFAGQMQTVAALIAGGLNTSVYVVGTGGFDFHINEVDGSDPTHATGAHTTLLGQVADAIAQFQSDMIQLDAVGPKVSDRVVGFTVSEFGRRPHDNGSWGTDHGAASVQFAFGTQVNGVVLGDAPSLTNLDDNGDLIKNYDFRDAYSTLLTDWFGMSLADAQTVLQDQSAGVQPLVGLIKSASGVSTSAPLSVSLSVYPNPMASSANVSIEVPVGAYTEIELASMDGKNVQQVLARTIAAGSYTIPLTLDVPSGAYLLSMRSGSARTAKVVEVIR
jgi:uncharacterized protein (DUF1501 family)